MLTQYLILAKFCIAFPPENIRNQKGFQGL